jgi:hypothetical protein
MIVVSSTFGDAPRKPVTLIQTPIQRMDAAGRTALL